MPDGPLPDDLTQWSANPYVLLGVSPQATTAEVKRAYLKLVRHYKPEHAPEQFQRLREALEKIQQWSALREPRRSFEEPEPAYSPQVPSGAPRVLQDDIDTLWEAACQGEEAPAYRELVKLRAITHNPSEVCLRLYWLLTANPALDAVLAPCDWLVSGLRATRLTGPLRELYRSELTANPREAVTQRCTTLLDCSAAAGPLADLLDWRWKGAARVERWDLIVADLSLVREKIHVDNEEVWGRLLLAALDHLAFVDEPDAARACAACRHELDQLTHLHRTLADAYDRLDLLAEVASGWQRLRHAVDVPRSWMSLIPLSWNQPLEVVEPEAQAWLAYIGERPHEALRMFDAISERSKPAAAQLGSFLERLYAQAADVSERTDRDAIQAAVRRFALLAAIPYSLLRARLLQFCLYETIDPIWLGSTVDALPAAERFSDESWADQIAADGPLRYVYCGFRAYWG